MTNNGPTLSSRKRLLLFSGLTAAVLATAWVTYFLISFDLNNYRHQAEEELSSLLSQPVKVGDISYNLHDANLALHVAGLQIGSNTSTLQINTPDILINLKWWPLLKRKIEFAKIVLVRPQIWLRPLINSQASTGVSQETETPTITNLDLLKNISINALEVLGGAVHLEATNSAQSLQQIDITELDAEFAGVRLNQATQLTIKGALSIQGQKEKSQWQLLGESSLQLDKSNVLRPHFNLDLDLKDLDLSAIRTLFAKQTSTYSIEGTSDLQLHIEGSPNTGIDFQVGLSPQSVALLPGPAYTTPILFKSLLANGRLQIYGDHPGIEKLSLQIDESRIAGNVNWTPAGQPFSTTFNLLNSSLSVPQFKQWLPDTQKSWHTIKNNLQDQGSIQVESAEFSLFKGSDSQSKWQVDQLKGELQHFSWHHETTPAVEIISLPFNFGNHLWQINNGRGRWGSLSLVVNGTGKHDQKGLVLTSLDFAGDALPDSLLKEWHIPQNSLSTSGKVGLSGHLEGPLDQINVDLQADLSEFSVIHSGGLTLTPGAEDTLALHATISPQKISLDHGALKWSVVNGHISGTFPIDNPENLAIDALLTINDLTMLGKPLPFLKSLQLYGQADLTINQRGLPENNRPEMVLTLRDAGLHATRYIADLSKINGRVQLTSTGFTAENLRVHLGDSPLTVQAQLEDFANPRLLLNAKAPVIHADDLIFFSDKAMLHDVNGSLEIDKDGLTFAPVDVHLEGGTKASVRGTISFHAPFDVRLDITSEYARISEVINLWTDRSEASKKRFVSTSAKTVGTKANATVIINASVKTGDLYGMSFHDATGVIVPTRDRLSIHPLDFSVGEGFCNSQVLIDFSTGGEPSILRISGHAQDVDALEVYRELLNQKNIVRGKLRGDFYLSGEIGPNYFPSSHGNFSFQIHDGVLHQFPVLSKIFSLLNVSQIFALELPDMDTQGMPFDLLSANFLLEEGRLKSEDLKIQSEAMNQSYAGELNLIEKEVDFSVAIHPLGTVDKIISHIPVAGWLLMGEDKALLTAHFGVKGKMGDTSVEVMPLDTLTEPTIGLLRRTLGLPFKLMEDPQILWGGEVDKE